MLSIARDMVTRGLKGGSAAMPREDLAKLTAAIAGVNATADLLARTRVREQAKKRPRFATFATAPTLEIKPPEEALKYFLSLTPEIGVNPKRFGDYHRRRAFTLAESTSQTLTDKIHKLISEMMASGEGNRSAADRIQSALDAAGVTPRNPGYSSMIWRTNCMDAYQQGNYEEAMSPDLEDILPAWQYLGIDDHRAGADHYPQFNKIYPRHAVWEEVRGPRPWNCRCGSRWLHRDELAEMLAAGKHVETSWGNFPNK